MEDIEDNIKNNSIVILKFDEEISLYDKFFDKITEFKTINITDKTIIEFYDIDILPTAYIYKNKNLLGTIEGYYTKTIFIKKIQSLLE